MTIDTNLLAQISADRALGSQILFGHRHPQESPPFHVQMIDLWRCADELVVIEAFRDAGKSTLAEEFLCLEGAFGNFHYTLLIGETYTKACQRLDAIDYEARTNIKLHRLFGGTILARKSTESRVWFKSGALIEAVGWEQELQSFKEHAHRPDRAYLDDPENAERVRDKAAVDASMKKLYLELLPAMDKKRRKVRITQTRRAEDCMVVRLSTSPGWLYRGFPVCNGEPDDPLTVSLWPDKYPMSWVRSERETYQKNGMLTDFMQAYMLQATDPSAKTFKIDMLGTQDVVRRDWMPKYVIYDPSRTTRERGSKGLAKSDRTGKVVVSRLGSQILVHESSGNLWKPSELINDLFEANEKHHPVKLAVEKNALDDWLLEPVRIEMLRRGRLLPLHPLQAPQDRNKDQFILGLQPFALAKDIVLIGGLGAHPQFVAEWSNWPNGPRDILNALAYSMHVFSGIPMYEDFSGANIAEAPMPTLGETVFAAFNASPSEFVCVAVVKEGRRLCVLGDWSATGTLSEAAKTVAFDLRTSFPGAVFQSWVPAETFDQWQRVALVPALRSCRLQPMRAEHTAIARGCLSPRIQTVWRGSRQFTVDTKAKLTLNALAAGYALPVLPGARQGKEPEPGPSRLIAEALETMVAMLDKLGEDEGPIPKGANVDFNPAGVAYVTSNPRVRT